MLQQLLREQVSIRDLGTILEILVEASQQSKNLVHLVESVRRALGRGLIYPLLDSEGGLKVLVLEQGLEGDLLHTFDPQSKGLMLVYGGRVRWGISRRTLLKKLVESCNGLTGGGSTAALPVLLCPSPARYHLRRWLEPFLPKVTVLAPSEIPPDIRVRSVGTIG